MFSNPEQKLGLNAGRMGYMEIEIEQVLYIDGREVSCRRETLQPSPTHNVEQRFWAAIENNAKDFRQAINSYEEEEPPF